MLSPLTNKIVAYSIIADFNTDIAIDWAIDLIAEGYDSENILILAGLSKPTNHFEAIKYINGALYELQLQPKCGTEGIVAYGSFYILAISKGRAVKENLEKLYNHLGYEKVIHDFYLLWWAWSDLDYGNAYQAYWDDATLDNIENIVVEIAGKWLFKYKGAYLE